MDDRMVCPDGAAVGGAGIRAGVIVGPLNRPNRQLDDRRRPRRLVQHPVCGTGFDMLQSRS